MIPSRDISRLIEIMAALRTPVTGCPWDLEQTFETIAPYTLEETYEVLDAIRRGDLVDLREELGDLLLQVVYHARMAEEAGAFGFDDVVEAITRKLIRRHPHVFGDRSAGNPGAVKALWDAIKAEEKAEKASLRGGAPTPGEPPVESALHGIKGGLSPMKRAVALQAAAGTVGFDWNDARAVLAKIREETAEIEAALDAGDADHVAEEIGDLMFVVANLARHAKVDPETAITAANAKFTRRFRAIEEAFAARDIRLADATLEEMEAEWVKAKAGERSSGA
jgi:nucleoside triphosphate diphosphatase